MTTVTIGVMATAVVLVVLLEAALVPAVRVVMPPPAFVDAFVETHELAGVVVRAPLEDGGAAVASSLANYWDASRHRPTVMVDSAADVPLARSNCSFECKIRNLQLVPVVTAASPSDRDWRREARATLAARDGARPDYWLVGVGSFGAEAEQEVKSLTSEVPLDMDDHVYFYFPEKENDGSSLILLEAYKILPGESPTVTFYGKWKASSDQGRGGGALDIAVDRHVWHRRSDMQGVTLRISTLVSAPYVNWLEFGERRAGEGDPVLMTGMFADIFHTLQEILNFTYVLGSPEDRQWGSNLGDGVWSGMVGQLQNKEIDIAPTDFTVTQERSVVMTFAVPITQIYHSLFIKNPAGTPNYLAYAEPFHRTTWIVLAIIVLVTPPFLYFAVNGGSLPFYDENWTEFTVGKSYVFTAGVMTFMRPWSVAPGSGRGRLAFACLLFGGTLTYYHWEAMLISYLATRVVVLPFQSLEECVTSSDYRISVLPGSSYEDAFKFAQDAVWQEAWRDKIEPFISTYPRTTDGLITQASTESQTALYNNFFAIRVSPEYTDCEIIAIPKKYDVKPYAYGFQKDSPLLGLFNFYLNQMRERGTIKKIIEAYETRPQECPDYSGRPLGLETCFSAFGLLILGLTAGFILYLIELNLVAMGRLLNKNTSYLESYGMQEDLHEDEDMIMADPTIDERAKSIIHEKNLQLKEKDLLLEKYQGKKTSWNNTSMNARGFRNIRAAH